MTVTIESIDDQEKNFLKFARAKHLVPGSKIKILSREEVANAMELKSGKEILFQSGFKPPRKSLCPREGLAPGRILKMGLPQRAFLSSIRFYPFQPDHR